MSSLAISFSLACSHSSSALSVPAVFLPSSLKREKCFIFLSDVKFLHTGIRNGFEGTVTKHSSTLERDAVYKKTSVLTRLPAYLVIHFVRFFYKEDKQLNAKVSVNFSFPSPIISCLQAHALMALNFLHLDTGYGANLCKLGINTRAFFTWRTSFRIKADPFLLD